MKKLIPILVVVALIAGAGYYFLNQPATNTPQSTLSQVKEATEWATAIASGRPTLCTMTKGEEKMDYLIKGKKMKATMVTLVETKKMTSYMINDEKYLYMWEDGQNVGTKMTIPTDLPAEANNSEPTKEGEEQFKTPDFDSESGFDNLENEGYTVKCDGATASDSDFVPPQSVKFTDLSEMTKAIPSPNANGEYDMKALEEMAKKYGATIPSEE